MNSVIVRGAVEGKVAIVTGGASGIGRATALLLATHGARVFVGDYRIGPAVAAEFEKTAIHLQHCDVRNSEDVAKLVGAAVSAAGAAPPPRRWRGAPPTAWPSASATRGC